MVTDIRTVFLETEHRRDVSYDFSGPNFIPDVHYQRLLKLSVRDDARFSFDLDAPGLVPPVAVCFLPCELVNGSNHSVLYSVNFRPVMGVDVNSFVDVELAYCTKRPGS